MIHIVAKMPTTYRPRSLIAEYPLKQQTKQPQHNVLKSRSIQGIPSLFKASERPENGQHGSRAPGFVWKMKAFSFLT